MYFLPNMKLIGYKNACSEKILSYQLMAKIGLPVLESIILSNHEIEALDQETENVIKNYLNNKSGMIRYLYHDACYHVKNGGKIVQISKEMLLKEQEEGADLWILEPCRREDNILCCNVCLNREISNLHIEFLGEGFDVSDINKGIMRSHEQMDIPYPIPNGIYGEWWKWAHFDFCTKEEYLESLATRKNKLKKSGSGDRLIFSSAFKAVDISIIECLFSWIEKIENSWFEEKPDFYNLSCSFQKNGRKICWDVQTPKGKMEAYMVSAD